MSALPVCRCEGGDSSDGLLVAQEDLIEEGTRLEMDEPKPLLSVDSGSEEESYFEKGIAGLLDQRIWVSEQ